MKIKWILSLIALVFLNVTPLSAQCGLYTSQNLWIDDSGNAVGDNYTQASCEEPTAYAEAHIKTPSGYEVAASASGSTTAEAIAQYSVSSERGNGEFWGFNSAFNACTQTDSFLPFDVPILIGGAYTKEVWIGGQLNGFCAVTSACVNTPTPLCAAGAIFVGQGSCSPAWNAYWLTWSISYGPWHCAPAISNPTSDTSPEVCTP